MTRKEKREATQKKRNELVVSFKKELRDHYALYHNWEAACDALEKTILIKLEQNPQDKELILQAVEQFKNEIPQASQQQGTHHKKIPQTEN